MGKYFNNKQQIYRQQRVLNRRDADKLIESTYRVYTMIGLLALHQGCGFGAKRCWRFLKQFAHLLDCYNTGYISEQDIETMVWTDIGIKYEEVKKDGAKCES